MNRILMKMTLTVRTPMAKNNYFWIATVLFLFSCHNEDRKVTSDLLKFPSAETGEMADAVGEISFIESEFDFGKVAVGEKVTHSYEFVNRGKAMLQIGQVTPSCGCTTLKDWPKGPISPGESGKITVEFNSSEFSGKVEKSIQVSTNGYPRDAYLKLRGEVSGVAVSKDDSGFEMKRTR